eukprot:gene13081-17637_t
MATHNETGKRGEEQAAQYLQKQGFVILEKNWRYGYLEVDLICLEKDMLVLVEVKTRADLRHGLPEEAVTRKKERHLLEAAERYLDLKNRENEVRFDIVSVWEEGVDVRINHIREAFTGMG